MYQETKSEGNRMFVNMIMI